MEKCIDLCQQCAIACRKCLYEMAGMDSPTDCPKCCIQCIDACNACITMMIAQNEWYKTYCRLCAEICEYCARQCEGLDNPHCQECASACWACAEECRRMAD